MDKGYYATVKIDLTDGGGSRGIWAAVPVRQAILSSRQALEPPAWLPAGTRPGFDLVSADGARQGEVQVAFNGVGAQANASHIVERLHSERLRLQRSTGSYNARGAAPPLGGSEHPTVLHFSGSKGEQSVVTISRQPNGETAITRINRFDFKE